MNPGFTARYEKYRQIFSGRRLPLAFVDLDNFDKNLQEYKEANIWN